MKNGTAMASLGMKDRGGEAVAPLAGPLRWAVEVASGTSVRIERKAPPPEVAAAVARNEGGHCIVQ